MLGYTAVSFTDSYMTRCTRGYMSHTTKSDTLKSYTSTSYTAKSSSDKSYTDKSYTDGLGGI